MEGHSNGNNCRNCESKLPSGAKFCPACGQKNTDGRLTFRELMAKLFDDLFSLDARIFQTLAALVVPGKLTQNFFAGKHIRYYHPIRLFIFSAALLIASISLSIPKEKLAAADGDWLVFEEKTNQRKFLSALDTLAKTAKTSASNEQTISTLDSLSKRIKKLTPTAANDSIPMGGLLNFNFDDSSDNLMMSKHDLINLPIDSLCEKYQVTSLKDKILVRQGIQIMRSPSSFLSYLISNILWMVLIMMPMLALVLKGVYFRRNFLYYEHLIFSFHVHTFLFLVIAISIPMQVWLNINFACIGVPLSFLYPVLALKRFYGQSWWKTLLKGVLISILYVVIFGLSFILMSMLSIFLF